MSSNKSKLAAYIEYIPVKLVLIILFFSPSFALVKLGRVIGLLLYYSLKKYRKVAYINLEIAFPKQLSKYEKKQIVKNSFKNFMQTFVEMILFTKYSREKIFYQVKIEGFEEIEKRLKKGQSNVVVSGHYGNWYHAAIIGSLLGMSVSVITRPLDNFLLDREMNKIFKKWGINVIPRKNATKRVLTLLREPNSVAFLIDQNAAIGGEMVPFFGVPASTMMGSVYFARKSNSFISLVLHHREKRGDRVTMEIIEDKGESDMALMEKNESIFRKTHF